MAVQNEYLYSEQFLNEMDKAKWAKAAKKGAEYLLEMRLPHGFTYDGGLCAIIGLLTGCGFGYCLRDYSFIDNIVVDCIEKYPVRVIGNILNSRDLDILTMNTKERIWLYCENFKMFPTSFARKMMLRFPTKQSLIELYEAPFVDMDLC